MATSEEGAWRLSDGSYLGIGPKESSISSAWINVCGLFSFDNHVHLVAGCQQFKIASHCDQDRIASHFQTIAVKNDIYRDKNG